MKDCSWIFDKITWMQLGMYKTNSLTGGSYVELPSENEAVLNIKNVHKSFAL